eukprot:5082752-Pyramimonas_sp.AAC.1
MMEPVKACASFAWGQRAPLGRMQRARDAVNRQLNLKASWNDARGPISTLWLTLDRIGWGMIPPKSVLKLVKEGVQRWQARKMLARHQDVCLGGERVWARAFRRCLGGAKAQSEPDLKVHWGLFGLE